MLGDDIFASLWRPGIVFQHFKTDFNVYTVHCIYIYILYIYIHYIYSNIYTIYIYISERKQDTRSFPQAWNKKEHFAWFAWELRSCPDSHLCMLCFSRGSYATLWLAKASRKIALSTLQSIRHGQRCKDLVWDNCPNPIIPIPEKKQKS